MALISQVPVAEVAAVVARRLEELLGHDVVLATGTPALGEPGDEILPEGATRTIVLPFADGVVGEVTLVVGEAFATAMEAATDDASLTTAAVPALDAGAAAISLTIDVTTSVAGAGEIATETLLTSVVGEFATVAIFENDVCVACVVIRIVEDAPAPHVTPIPAESAPPATVLPEPSPFAAEPDVLHAEAVSDEFLEPGIPAEPVAPLAPRPAEPAELAPALPAAPYADVPAPATMAVHEFQPFPDGPGAFGSARPLTLLNDVNMQVTAELGRRRLHVRDIVALKPGSVIELDRAAGSPVDVLVNGALVWHGEVVVVDDEFGIRVSEIVTDEY